MSSRLYAWRANCRTINNDDFNSADYTKFMLDTYAAEKATIERLGLAYKGA